MLCASRILYLIFVHIIFVSPKGQSSLPWQPIVRGPPICWANERDRPGHPRWWLQHQASSHSLLYPHSLPKATRCVWDRPSRHLWSDIQHLHWQKENDPKENWFYPLLGWICHFTYYPLEGVLHIGGCRSGHAIFHSLRTICNSLLCKIWGGMPHPPMIGFKQIRDSFLHEILTSCGSMKVFSLECLSLYGTSQGYACVDLVAYGKNGAKF